MNKEDLSVEGQFPAFQPIPGGPCKVRSKLNKFEHVRGRGVPHVSGGGGAEPGLGLQEVIFKVYLFFILEVRRIEYLSLLKYYVISELISE